jgi:hypothetical protein
MFRLTLSGEAIVQVLTLLIAIAGLVFSVVALRRTEQKAEYDRVMSGPLPVLSVVVAHEDGSRLVRITLQNQGRLTFTANGVGLAFRTAEGVLRHVVTGADKEVEVDPEKAPRSWVLPAPMIEFARQSLAPGGQVLIFATLGTNTYYGDAPLPADLLADWIEWAPANLEASFQVFDSYDDFLREAQVRSRSDGTFEESEQRYSRFYRAEPYRDMDGPVGRDAV